MNLKQGKPMHDIFQLNREQLKALLILAAIHAPSYATAVATVEKVIGEFEDPDTIVHAAITGMTEGAQ